ncbi:MAG: hypothetical protein JXL81_04610, partial [Deltaproteobacteria bacterium]|nr:hypothetical protein [Deltaproteobacteria bacterium]
MLNRFLALVALLVISLFSVMAAARSNDLATGGFTRQYAADKHAFNIARDGLDQTVVFAQERSALFKGNASRENGLMPRPDKMAIWGAWSSFLNCQAALDAVRQRYGRFGQLSDKSQREASFILSRAAFLAGYHYALEFIALTDSNPDLDIILNEAVPELGIPSDTFARIKFRFLNVAAATEFSALEVIGKQYNDGDQALMDAIEADRAFIWKMGKGKGHALTLKNALTVVQRAGQSAWFPVQKGISEWMGDTKVLRKDMHLISEDQISAMGRQLAPGDILFERHEWYLSNLGLPGFWTHVALYVGTPE